MQPQRGLPPRPSLSVNPLFQNHSRNVASQQEQPINIGALAAQTLTGSLANPHGQTSNYHSYTNANYYSYFTQVPRPLTTADGYTLSSTYVPSAPGPSVTPQSRSWPPAQRGRTSQLNPTNRVSQSRPFTPIPSAALGDSRCKYNGCSFVGSKKTVEIHMMDRHLIFPPGWKNQSKGWDADPSLRGKPVPIPGTGVTLDTPEALDAWLAERKRKWPTKQTVDDKKKKAREATERGEINPSELTSKSRKRPRFNEDHSEFGSKRRGNQSGRGRGSNRRLPDSGWRGRGFAGTRPSTRPTILRNISLPHEPATRGNIASFHSDDSTSEPGSDMDPIRDAVSSKLCDLGEMKTTNGNRQIKQDDGLSFASNPDLSIVTRPCRTHYLVPQPRGLPRNPFASRPSLLRNLLLPEIRHTVSNLSQAIHFLVENDFLEDVELNPGEADSQRIKVLKSASFSEVSEENVRSVTQD